jgi:hypothetical protein
MHIHCIACRQAQCRLVARDAFVAIRGIEAMVPQPDLGVKGRRETLPQHARSANCLKAGVAERAGIAAQVDSPIEVRSLGLLPRPEHVASVIAIGECPFPSFELVGRLVSEPVDLE